MLTRNLTRNITQPLTRAIARPITSPSVGGGVEWTFSSMFAQGEQGAWYDPSDLSTMFQDVSGTVPVLADGDPVALILDKSGNGNHASQSIEASRPTYKTSAGLHWLQFNGADSFLLTSAVNFTGTDKITAWCAINQSAVANGQIYEIGTTGNNGSLNLYVVSSLRPTLVVRGGTSASWLTGSQKTVNVPYFQTSILDLAGANQTAESKQRINWSLDAGTYAGTADDEGGNFGTHAIRIGRRADGTYPLNGKIFGLVIRGAATDEDALFNGEDEMARAIGTAIVPRVPTVFALGDSTVAEYLGNSSLMSFLDSAFAKTTVAAPGNTIDQQRTAWNSAVNRHVAQWVIIQIGLNDLNPGAGTTADAIGRLQSLVNEVRAAVPATAKVYVSKMIPCRARLIALYGGTDGPIAYQRWLDMNEAIEGLGGTPITGVDGRITAHEPLMNDGSGNLDADHDTGDGIHPNNAGRAINAAEWEEKLLADGVTV